MQVNNLTISDYARASHTKAILHVHFSSSTLEDTEGLDQRGRHAVLRLVDVEVFQGAASISDLVRFFPCNISNSRVVLPLGLRTPVLVSGDLLKPLLVLCGTIAARIFTHLDFTKGIALNTRVNRLGHTHQFVCLSTALLKQHTILTVVPNERLLEKVFKD